MPEGSHGQSDGLRSRFRASSTSMSKDSHSPRRVSPQPASFMPEGSHGQSDGLRSHSAHRELPYRKACAIIDAFRLRGPPLCRKNCAIHYADRFGRDRPRRKCRTVLCTVCRGDRPGLRRPCRRNRPVHRAGLGEHRFGRNRPRGSVAQFSARSAAGIASACVAHACGIARSMARSLTRMYAAGISLLGKRRAIDCAASGPALPGPRDARRVEAQCLGSGSLGQRADPAVRGRLWRMGIFRPPRWRRGGAGRDQSRQRQEDHPAP